MFSFIKSVLSPVSAMKIEPLNEKQLEKKLHLITQYLINSHNQFQSWMLLQSQNHLHATLEQISHNSHKYTEEEICAIYQFYTLLLINCRDQLLVCKLVSDQFVIKLCRLEIQGISGGLQAEVEPYRINLIKAYLGAASHQAVKYMVIQDQFKVFNESVKLYEGKVGTVEQTTIANSIQNIFKKVNDLPFLWQSIWVEQGLMKLYTHCFSQIISQLPEKDPEYLEETIIFLIELHCSISKSQIKEEIEQFTENRFNQMIERIQQIDDIDMKIRDCSYLYGVFKTYSFEGLFVHSVMNWFEKVVFHLFELSIREEIVDESIFITAFLFNKIVTSSHSKLSERIIEDQQESEKVTNKRKQIMLILMRVLREIPKIIQQLPVTHHSNLLGFISQFMPALFYLKLTLHQQEENPELSILILQIFNAYTQEYKKLLSKNQQWFAIIRWYEEGSARVVREILEKKDNFQRIKESSLHCVLTIFEILRNFRYMIVETTTLDPKSIKQEKFHHTTFSSVGMAYEPNAIVETGLLAVVTPCIVHHNYHLIPAIIAEDRECFIVAFKVNAEECKILMNIRFTDIQNFVYGDTKNSQGRDTNQVTKFVRINLRGSQQIVLQFTNPKVSGVKFKQYLIKSKDNARQRQLTFLNSWAKIYEKDTLKSLQILKKNTDTKSQCTMEADDDGGL